MGGPPQKGVVQYQPSPFRVQPMKGVLKNSIFHGSVRLLHLAPYVVPPFVAGSSRRSTARADRAGWAIMRWATVRGAPLRICAVASDLRRCFLADICASLLRRLHSHAPTTRMRAGSRLCLTRHHADAPRRATTTS